MINLGLWPVDRIRKKLLYMHVFISGKICKNMHLKTDCTKNTLCDFFILNNTDD